MAISEIPASFNIKCDGCGNTVVQATKSRPKHWSELHIARDLYDWSGHPAADGSVSRLLCDKCSTAVSEAVNAACVERRRDRDAGSAEDAKRLNPEGAAARAEGIAQNQSEAVND